jgi:hypothetical protein
MSELEAFRFWGAEYRRLSLRLEARYAKLPEEKTPAVGSNFLAFRFAAAAAMTAAIVDAEQDGPPAGSCRLQPGRHFARHPRIDTWIVAPRGE